MKDARDQDKKFAMFLGVGLDGTDGHYRRTRGKNFILVGGSDRTHEVLQEKAISLNEELDRRGKSLEDVESTEEMRDIAHDAGLS
jgi:hypothetical protein